MNNNVANVFEDVTTDVVCCLHSHCVHSLFLTFDATPIQGRNLQHFNACQVQASQVATVDVALAQFLAGLVTNVNP